MPKAKFDQRDSFKASLEVSWLIVRAKKLHKIGEELIKPAATRITEIMCGKVQTAKLGMVPLSARTVDELAQNIKEQLMIAIKKSLHSAIQLDETTDVGSVLSS